MNVDVAHSDEKRDEPCETQQQRRVEVNGGGAANRGLKLTKRPYQVCVGHDFPWTKLHNIVPYSVKVGLGHIDPVRVGDVVLHKVVV